jgi:hypothetical protein
MGCFVSSLTEAPPIRYSVGQDDFDPDIGRRLRICVDGVEQVEVVEYDCAAGTVLRNALDAEGKAQANASKTEVLRETVHGTVTVEWEPEGASQSL